MPTPSDADLLVAEMVGLLFEGLGLDDTLDGAESLRFVEDIAALDTVAARDVEAVQRALGARLDRVEAQVDARRRFIEHAAAAGLDPTPPAVVAAQQVLTSSVDTVILNGLQNVPVEVGGLTAPAFKLAHLKAKQACRPVQEAKARLGSKLLPSALTEIDLEAEAKALRNGGWLFGLLGSPADSAKERVKPHLRPAAHDLDAGQLAVLLDDARTYQQARAGLQTHVDQAHPWLAWAVDIEQGVLREQRTASLTWLMAQDEAGVIGPAERELLIDETWRGALGHATGRAWARTFAAVDDQAGQQNEVVASALSRVDVWLSKPLPASVDDVQTFARTVSGHVRAVASALVLVGAAASDAVLGRHVSDLVVMSNGVLGSGDPNRARFRALMTEARDALKQAGDPVTDLRPRHPQLAEAVSALRETQALALGDLEFMAPARGPLRVAIAGRTKAGKTSLRNVLVRDLSRDGVGEGAHRTTRTANAFTWDRIVFVDTPGVAAMDDDYDAEVAVRACTDADAVVWVFAESLREEEGQILQGLLATKPLLVIFNVKESVATPRRLDAFARNPTLILGEAPGFAARIDQMAEEAGVRSPLFLAVHVTAARRALLADGEAHTAWNASGVPSLEAELRRVLTSQAQGLRSIRLADQVRTPVLVAAARTAAACDDLAVQTDVVADRVAKEEREQQEAVHRAMEHARATNHKHFAEARASLTTWVESMKGRADSLDTEWSTFLERLAVDATLAGISSSLRDDAHATGLLLDREDRLNADSRVRTNHKKTSGWRRVWREVKTLVGLVIRKAPTLAKKARMGWVGIAAIAADVVATVGRAITEDLRASQIDRHAWETDAGAAARRELDRLLQEVDRRLDGIERSLGETVDRHFADTRTELRTMRDTLAAYRQFGSLAGRLVTDIDLATVQRVLDLGGLASVQVSWVERVPNRHVRVRVDRDADSVMAVLEAVFTGCSSEAVAVTRSKRKHLRTKETTP